MCVGVVFDREGLARGCVCIHVGEKIELEGVWKRHCDKYNDSSSLVKLDSHKPTRQSLSVLQMWKQADANENKVVTN